MIKYLIKFSMDERTIYICTVLEVYNIFRGYVKLSNLFVINNKNTCLTEEIVEIFINFLFRN